MTTEPVTGTVVCGAVAAHCICDEPPDHVDLGLPHLCKCQGSWRGVEDEDSFEVVSWPQAMPTNPSDAGEVSVR